MIARGVCAQQDLDCKLSVTRLDFGGLTISGLDARAPKAESAALSARELAIELAWDNPFSPRAVAVAGEALVVRLDLTGKRPLLGDLNTAITNFTKPTDKPPAPLPRLDFKSIKVIGETLSGPVEANGTIVAQGPDAFVIDLSAPAASLGLSGATVQLAGGTLKATVAGDRISGAARLDLARFEAEGASIADVKIDASLEQVAGVLKGEGAATLGAVALKDTSLSGAQAKATLESAALDTAAFDFERLLAGVRRLDLAATTGEGAIAGATWKAAQLSAQIAPIATGQSGGDITLAIDEMRLPQGASGRVELAGEINLATDGRVGAANGTARVLGGALSTQARNQLANAIAAPLEAALPSFADAARRALDRAASAFEVSAPWSAEMSRGFHVSLGNGAEVRARSGMMATLAPAAGAEKIGTWSLADGTWSAAGSLRLSGGGAPQLSLDIGKAQGAPDVVAFTGAASLRPWKVGSDQVSAEAAGLEFGIDKGAGRAVAQLTVRLDGAMGGGVWKGARGTGKVNAVWDRETFAADAPRGAVIEWDEARYGETVFGAAALHYAPTGRLAERVGDGLVGVGILAPVTIPATGDGYSAKTMLGQIGINWRAAGGFRANFNAAPSGVDLAIEERAVPIRIEDITGILDLRRGWRVTGEFRNGTASAAEAAIADLAGKFDLGGAGGDIDGSLSEVTMRVFDPNEAAKRRFEEASFEGGAALRNSVVDFNGIVAMKASGMRVARIEGKHDLDSNTGSLTFADTPLIFAPRAFQPSDLSPALRGPANVTGRIDVSGSASWSEDDLKASAVADFKKVGFALANAGVFEGVTGRVEIADLLEMRTTSPQTLKLDKVTFGLPIEQGSISFMLIGYESIRLVDAEWPFAGGSIRVRPTEFEFGAEAQNRIVAVAENWDLAKIIEQFKVPDVKLRGVVGGDFPVVFSTGSVKIDNAVLQANKEGGVIQYSGSAADAAAQSDPNTKMTFDALKDFRYEVLKLEMNGELTGRMQMKVNVLGRNPAVLGGQSFDLNIGIDSALMELLSSATERPGLRTAIERATGDQE